MLIARQEMEHLGLVSNLLTAIGEAPWLDAPEPAARAAALPPRGGRQARAADRGDARAASRCSRSRTGAGAGRARLLLERARRGPSTRSATRRSAALYDEIRQLFQQLGEELFIGPPGAAARDRGRDPGAALRGDPLPTTARDLRRPARPGDRHRFRAGGRRADRRGGRGRAGRHQRRATSRAFSRCCAELPAERGRDPDFEPARPVTAHPSPHEIADPRTRRGRASCSTTRTRRCCCC